ncbi:MAG: TldD/PmbA family protein, partial [Prevotella sp.]|nr:TldD/PmbA family protein [Prevotella sp.]
MMKKKLLNVFILFLLPLCVTHAITANEDTLLKVLREELAADMAELQQQEQKPYWMSFFVEDSHIASVIATFGSLGNSGQEHTRTFMPQIRIGSPEIDNYKSNNTNQSLPTAQLPLADANPDAIRAAIWQATVNAYFRSEEAYRGVSDRLRRMTQDEDKAPSFSMAPKEEYYEAPLPHPTLTPEERKEWEQRLCRVSAVFRQWKHFNSAQARLEVETRRTYLVNTEGTSVVQNRQHFRLLILGETNAEDGMTLPLVKTYFATQLDSLPSEEQLCADVEDIGRRLIALEKAPIAEPFTGPAIMSGEASG